MPLNPHHKTLRLVAGTALALAALAAIAGSPSPTRVSFDLRELASLIDNEEDHVSPEHLASMIMAPSGSFRIVDVRDSASYEQYHIPGAELHRISSLAETSFRPLEPLILYSDGGTHAAQAWFLLKARGLKNVYTLRGGLDQWKETILDPKVPKGASAAQRDSVLKIASFFGSSVPSETRADRQRPVQPRIRFHRERERTRDGC